MPKWDSVQYSKFINERTQPAYDLARRINVLNPKRIVDIGCGPGNSTQVLTEIWSDAKVSAFDSSSDMLEQAKQQSIDVDWFQSSVEEWATSETYDIIFSNAVLQWVYNHEELLPVLMGYLNAGGALAVQLPAHYNSPLHQQLINVAKTPAWSKYTVEACDMLSLSPPSFYYDILSPVSSHIDMWETQYFHVMENVQSILEWFKGTGLRPFLEAIPNQKDREDFESALLQEYEASYFCQKNGKVLFPFKRFFFVAYK